MDQTSKSALYRAVNGEEKLWKVWWMGGPPVAGMAGALTILAETAGKGGYAGWGDGCDVVKLLMYLLWAQPAWRCSRNVENGIWTAASRFAVCAGLALVVLV